MVGPLSARLRNREVMDVPWARLPYNRTQSEYWYLNGIASATIAAWAGVIRGVVPTGASSRSGSNRASTMGDASSTSSGDMGADLPLAENNLRTRPIMEVVMTCRWNSRSASLCVSSSLLCRRSASIRSRMSPRPSIMLSYSHLRSASLPFVSANRASSSCSTEIGTIVCSPSVATPSTGFHASRFISEMERLMPEVSLDASCSLRSRMVSWSSVFWSCARLVASCDSLSCRVSASTLATSAAKEF
mmetsp:Transcript_3612/g.8536  ORF Transcript_3612/g.8536 Transcript_3612/m.8536 type:complete len:246 (+) Transcript_3612:967-1704(+)